MIRRTVAELAAAVGGTLRRGEDGRSGAEVRSVGIDSRRAGPGLVFFALPGERVDGHEFVADALRRGAAAVVRSGWAESAESAGETPPGALVEVADPRRALLRLAEDERGRTSAPVVGITGSTGKTCTKDLAAAVLATRLRVVASPASFNTEVGLPLTLLAGDETTEAFVCEMGSRGPGHIRLLCDVARPRIGVVTNVGVAHMELFGSPEVLWNAKAELPEALPADGAAVLNADDPVVRGYASRTPARTVLFGTGSDADVRAERIEMSRTSGRATFVLRTPAGSARVTLPAPGEHLVPDALAAAAVGWVMGVPAEESAGALADAALSGGRMEVTETPAGLRVVNDAYNANPTSMAAGLKAAKWMAGSGRCIAVLGEMAELGPISASEHERVGELLARLRIDGLVTVGPEARLIAVAAEREGVEPDRIAVCDDVATAVEAVGSLALPGDLVLVKASRVAGLERVVAALSAEGPEERGAVPEEAAS